MHIPQNKIKSFLSGHGILGNVAGALLRAVTPLWSFTTIPITFAFIEADFPFGAVMSFTIASPLLNPIIMAKITSGRVLCTDLFCKYFVFCNYFWNHFR
jgi:hypothetical protein